MMNYIRSELYRSVKNRNLKCAIIVFTGMILLLMGAIVYLNQSSPNFPYANTRYALGNIYKEMPVMMVVLIFISALIDDSEYRNHTLKHSVGYGIPRNTIYIGRYIVQAIVCTVIYAAMSALLCILSFALLEHSNVGELEGLIRVSIGGYTCLLATLALTFCFLMNFENQSVVIAYSVVITIVVPIIINQLSTKFQFARWIARYLPYNQLAFAGPLVQAQGSAIPVCLEATLIGLGWMAAFLIIGMLSFQKKEVK